MATVRRCAVRALDSAPVLILAAIAGAGSFAHIRDTAAQHGQHGPMAWAIAVCVDLTCVMAARERQRDKRTGRVPRRVSWPTLVLTGGVLLSLAANLDQAQPDTWGRITAATPAAAFLVAVSMLERRSSHHPATGRVPVVLAEDGQDDHAVPVLASPDPLSATEHRPGGSRLGPLPRCSTSPAGSPLSTRTPTARPSPATYCAPGWAFPTSSPPTCFASSAPHRKPPEGDPMRDQLIPADLLARAQVISGLRQLADYLDHHPQVPVNEYGWDLLAFTRADADAAGRAEVGQIATLLGAQANDDTADGGHITATRTFGRITYKFIHVTARRRAAHQALMSYANAVTPDQITDADSPEAA